MQLLNQKVIFKQLDRLFAHIAEQLNQHGDPWLKNTRFDHHLFQRSHHKLSSYLSDCRQDLAHLQLTPRNEEQVNWQVERLCSQGQALLTALTSLPKTARPAVSRREELEGYAQRLTAMIEGLEARLQQTESLHEQQTLLGELEKTQQRLVRCQAAQQQYEWEALQPN